MRPTFLTRLVNGPLYDPIVYLRILNQHRSLMLDCGSYRALSNHELMLVGEIYISHTHMDHFMGFDDVLRVILHRDAPLDIYGPPGLAAQVLAKLHGYTWNLTQNYALEIRVHEVEPDRIVTHIAPAREGFRAVAVTPSPRQGALVNENEWYQVEAMELDHNIPCLGYVITEAMHINIRGEVLAHAGYQTGPWLGRLKAAILSGRHDLIEVPARDGMRTMASKDLARDLVIVSPGQKITYLADLRYSEANLARIQDLAMHTDTLFIETFYPDELNEVAWAKAHLTARQAGAIARLIQAKRVVPMHVSPRFHDQLERLEAELRE